MIKPGQGTPDNTRNGIARGVVVVPEFPAIPAFVLIVPIFAFVAYSPKNQNKSNYSSNND